ncbi:hypothetical protein [Streptomyces hypolithicus]
MIQAKSVFAVIALATGVSAFAAPAATAAASSSPQILSVPDELNSLGASALPADRRADVPGVTEQLGKLGQLNELGQLHQVTGLVAPATGLVSGIE